VDKFVRFLEDVVVRDHAEEVESTFTAGRIYALRAESADRWVRRRKAEEVTEADAVAQATADAKAEAKAAREAEAAKPKPRGRRGRSSKGTGDK